MKPNVSGSLKASASRHIIASSPHQSIPPGLGSLPARSWHRPYRPWRKGVAEVMSPSPKGEPYGRDRRHQGAERDHGAQRERDPGARAGRAAELSGRQLPRVRCQGSLRVARRRGDAPRGRGRGRVGERGRGGRRGGGRRGERGRRHLRVLQAEDHRTRARRERSSRRCRRRLRPEASKVHRAVAHADLHLERAAKRLHEPPEGSEEDIGRPPLEA